MISRTNQRRLTAAMVGAAIVAAVLSALVVLTIARPSGPGAADAGRADGQEAAAEVPAGTLDPDAGHHPEAGLVNVDVSVADPSGVRIPTIGVDATTIPLGLRSDGSIEVPQDYEQTGWWADGPEPGEPGPAVVLGHVDSVDGPAVFSRLRELTVGDVVHIDREDGTTVSYQVNRIEQHPKDDFPTEAVYGRNHEQSVLRLVTCGGTFDRNARSYVDNVIVFASLVAT